MGEAGCKDVRTLWGIFQHCCIQLTVAIHSSGNVFESIVVQGAKKGAVALMVEVSLTDDFFKELGLENSKASAVRSPSDALTILFLGEHMVHLLRECHVLNVDGRLVSGGWRHLRKVTVGMVHDPLGPPNGLNDDGLNWPL